MNIVVCEDDKDLLGLIEIIMDNEEYQLLTASDDKELRQIMDSPVKIDLLVIDYWLKKTKADQIITEIREANHELPIVLMSAISDLPEVSKRLGVDDYIKKPFDVTEFENTINKYIK